MIRLWVFRADNITATKMANMKIGTPTLKERENRPKHKIEWFQ
jgi:hypothetical protein